MAWDGKGRTGREGEGVAWGGARSEARRSEAVEAYVDKALCEIASEDYSTGEYDAMALCLRLIIIRLQT
jgi:hypothetical protein